MEKWEHVFSLNKSYQSCENNKKKKPKSLVVALFFLFIGEGFCNKTWFSWYIKKKKRNIWEIRDIDRDRENIEWTKKMAIFLLYNFKLKKNKK